MRGPLLLLLLFLQFCNDFSGFVRWSVRDDGDGDSGSGGGGHCWLCAANIAHIDWNWFGRQPVHRRQLYWKRWIERMWNRSINRFAPRCLLCLASRTGRWLFSLALELVVALVKLSGTERSNWRRRVPLNFSLVFLSFYCSEAALFCCLLYLFLCLLRCKREVAAAGWCFIFKAVAAVCDCVCD